MRNRNTLRNDLNIVAKNFEYNTDLVSRDAFDLHIQLYNNYVNKINEKINEFNLDTYNANAVVLHELWFDNIGNTHNSNLDDFGQEFIVKFFNIHFGGYDIWEKNFIKVCMDTRPVGWVALVWDNVTKNYKNIKIISHDCGTPIGCKIMLLIDLFEHSFTIDYKVNKNNYINKFLVCVDWNVVKERIISHIYNKSE